MTFISIFASIGTFIYSTEAGKRAIDGVIKWLWKYDLKGALLGKDAIDTTNLETSAITQLLQRTETFRQAGARTKA